MNRKTYLRRLRAELTGISESEVENLISYYNELFDDGIERGKTEEEICAGLEPPETVAENYKQENGFAPSSGDKGGGKQRDKRRRSEESQRRSVPVWLIVLGFPAWFPLLIVAFALAFVLVIMLFVFIVTLGALSLGFTVGGVYFIVMSFGLFGGHVALAFTQIGWGVCLIGLGFLLALLVPVSCKAFAAVFRKLARIAKPEKEERRGKKGALVFLICGAALFVVGIAVGTCGYAGLGFDYRNLWVSEDLIERTETLELTESLAFYSDNLELTVQKTDGEARVVFYEAENVPKTFSSENGTVTLTASDRSGVNYLKSVWERGLLSSAFPEDGNKATLFLPEDFSGVLSVNTENGSILLGGFQLGDVTLSTVNGAATVLESAFRSLSVTTKNGAISLKAIDLEGDLTAESYNGMIKVETVTADTASFTTKNGAILLQEFEALRIKAQTNNGAIKTLSLGADEIELVCSNGAITGSVAGKASDYRITAETGNGSCNLTNTATGDKTLSVRTGNGMIKLTFTES